MNKKEKTVFPCRKCHKNISVSRFEVEESIKSKGSFECPYCKEKNTKSADIYTRI
ncbi:MAG TPA: hypothetical protein QF468_08370 [Nitrospinota bacterium]|jgi:DNA-directed RNA polymerase subunit RPC12/RpoP|nr:hypothetical protein [Nitrospinota bacterium]